ncbi:MAG TPA: hypothetical protein VLJ59_08790 [Mycobacteriales bacterium]|nr:hypothetical protein [Mycobacteriales bacterium]
MTGIQEPSNIQEYVRHTWGDANGCMSPQDRAAGVVADVNEQLQAVGVPQVGWRFNAAHGTGAVFAFQTWEMELGESPYSMDVADNATADQQAWQVSAVYHEARHSEQWFRMARERIGLGATVDQVVQATGLPESVVQWAAQSPITQCDAAQYEAEEWYQSVYGAGAAHRESTLQDVQGHYQDYRNLPEEADAWRTGDAVTQEYHDYGHTTPGP